MAKKPAPKSNLFRLVAVGLLLGLVGMGVLLSSLNTAPLPAPTASVVGTEAVVDETPPTFAQLPSRVAGIKVSSAPAEAAEYFVFFDPQCPHCSDLWHILADYQGKISVTWIPVAFLNKKSVLQGADILNADDPVQRLTLHEGLMRQQKGGLAVTGGPAEPGLSKLQANARVLSSLKAVSVPFVMGKAANGGPVQMVGAGPAEQVRQKLGLPPLE